MTRPRLLHLVRHGDTVGQSSIRFWGSTDLELSDVGRAQVAALASVVQRVDADALVHSPMRRATESARIFAAALGLEQLPWHVETAFAEIDFGRIEGLSADEIAAREPEWHAAWRARKHDGFPGGETLAGFAERVRGGFERTLARTAGDLVIVAHRGIIRVIADLLLPGQGEEATDLASLSTLQVEPARVLRWNVRG